MQTGADPTPYGLFVESASVASWPCGLIVNAEIELFCVPGLGLVFVWFNTYKNFPLVLVIEFTGFSVPETFANWLLLTCVSEQATLPPDCSEMIWLAA